VSNDTVLIAGASSAIGLALLHRLASDSRTTLLAHCNSNRAGVDDLIQSGGFEHIHPLVADFSDAAAVRSLLEEVTGKFGTPNKIVYLPASPLRYERFAKFDLDAFNRDMHIQVWSAIILLRRLAPAMAKLPRARIVFVLSSVTRGLPPRFMSMYTIVKHAQLGLMRALASEYSASGLTVNGIGPGMVDTPFVAGIPPLAKEAAAAAAPRGRIATPADVIGAIEFMLSEGADYITGVEVPVSGGVTN
jgi:3-oxoacyl-[acyl-carrier protein] reductase